MTALTALLSGPLCQRLGWTLVHFLWQGAAVAAGLAVTLRLLRRRRPQTRWAAACAALAMMAALPAVTACLLRPPPAEPVATAETAHSPVEAIPGPTHEAAPIPLPVAPALAADPTPAPAVVDPGPVVPAAQPRQWLHVLADLLRPLLPWAVLAWLAGVTGMSLRQVGGWAMVARLRRSDTGSPGRAVLDAFDRLARRLGVRGAVRVLASARVAVPIVAGWLRPVVLLPVSALTSLTPEQLQAVLAHELAHVRRHDGLVRALQAVVETFLFYHPAVWWVSGRIRAESENCCDDLAVGVCGDRHGYAHALVRAAELGRARPYLAAATGGELLSRIRRLLALPGADAARANRWLAGVLVVASLAIAGAFLCTATDTTAAATPPADAAATKEPERLWGELGSTEAGRADKAIAAMAATGDRAVAFLATKLTGPPVDAERMEGLVKRLGSNEYAVRRSAHEELEGLGRAALGEARRILKQGRLSAEVRARLTEFVSEYGDPPPWAANARRFDRAIAVLARIGDEGAKGLLERLSASEPADRLSKRARAALVRLAAPREMRGTVRDGRGRPVEGAKVSLYYRRSPWGLGNAVVETVRTDQAGRFKFTRRLVYEQLNGTTYKDYYIVLATHPDYALAWQVVLSGLAPSPRELVLTEPQKRSFKVTDRQDRPLANARVWLSGAGDRVDRSPAFRTSLSLRTDVGLVGAATDAAGIATVTNVPKTNCSFDVSCPGYADAWVYGGRARRVRLAKAGVVSGAVRSLDAKPVAGAVVSLECDWRLHHYFLARTDQAGRFRFDKLFGVGGSPRTDSGGRYIVSLRHPDYTMAPRKVQVAAGEVVKDFDIDAVPGTLVLGRVLEPKTDRPLPGARVQGSTASGRVGAYADQMGEFSWRVLPGEATFFFLTAPRGSYVVPDNRTLRAVIQGKHMPLTIYAPSVVRPTTTAAGAVLAPDGSAAAGALVYARATTDFDTSGRRNYIPRTVTNRDGTFELEGVPTGHKLMLYAESADRRWAFAGQCDVPVGRAAAPVLRLQPTTSAKVLIKDADGKIWPRVSVAISPVVGGQTFPFYRRTARTDDQGYLKIGGIVPGLSYSIADRDYGRSPWSNPQQFGPRTIILAPQAPARDPLTATTAPSPATPPGG